MRVRHLDDLPNRVDGAEHVRDVRDGHELGLRSDELLKLRKDEFASVGDRC